MKKKLYYELVYSFKQDFDLKVKNVITDKDENDEIKVDESRGTEIIVTSDGHQSMKDFITVSRRVSFFLIFSSTLEYDTTIELVIIMIIT